MYPNTAHHLDAQIFQFYRCALLSRIFCRCFITPFKQLTTYMYMYMYGLTCVHCSHRQRTPATAPRFRGQPRRAYRLSVYPPFTRCHRLIHVAQALSELPGSIYIYTFLLSLSLSLSLTHTHTHAHKHILL